MTPHTAPSLWPDTRLGRLAAAIYKDSPDIERAARLDIISKCRVALIGLADDTGVELNHGRPGAAKGPHAFRAALARYGVAIPFGEWRAFEAGRALDTGRASRVPASPDHPPYPHVFDAGDIIPGDTLEQTHERVTQATAALLDLNLFPIAIGGGHDLTFPFVRALAQRHPGMRGVYLDAHLDVRAEPGSGMPFRRLIEDCGISALTCIGVNPLSNTQDHLDWFLDHNGRIEPVPSPALIPRSADRSYPWFLSLDLDVLDQSFAPGVSAMNPAGLTPQAVAELLTAAGRNPALKCFDIMELNPLCDESGRTARLAAHLFLTFLRGYSERTDG